MTLILAVDDNEEALFALESLLTQNDYQVRTANSPKKCFEILEHARPDLILVDWVMPEQDGIGVINKIKSDPDLRYIPVILVTSKDSPEDISFALENGADDYIRKPYGPSELLGRVKAALRTRRLYQELKRETEARTVLQNKLVERTAHQQFVGNSKLVLEVISLIEKVSNSKLPVLISGESGTGKEVVASLVHSTGNRGSKPMVIQNCSAISENLLESELFGHLKGSFSGALRDKLGLFEVADGSSFFLDEIGDMPPGLQAKLLRVLEDGSFLPIGGTKPRKVDVRIIAATNKNLEQAVKSGTFREDLYYRLNGVQIRLPSLRERKEDLPSLCAHFLASISERERSPLKRLSAKTAQAFENYDWPGNVRQLRNELERLCLMSGGDLEISESLLSFPRSETLGEQTQGLKAEVEKLERQLIQVALTQAAGNKTKAAKELGISRSNLIAKVQEYGLE